LGGQNEVYEGFLLEKIKKRENRKGALRASIFGTRREIEIMGGIRGARSERKIRQGYGK